MLTAMGLSVLFLLSYVAYHMTNDPTRYGGEGVMRGVYFFLLITHIVSAAVSFPFILFTLVAGLTNRFDAHRRMARWVFPLWLYVAVTGPVCYLMLRPYY
jgi:putative membrane protein